MVEVKFGMQTEASIVRSAQTDTSRIKICSLWDVEHWRGEILVSKTQDKNVVTSEGLDALLDIMFHADTQITTWYIALVESNTTPIAGLTYATPTYTESTAYTEGARQAFVEAAASGQSIDNTASKAAFTMNATKTIYGAALVGGGSSPTDNTDTAGGGTLFSYSLFSSSKDVVNSDVLNVSVTITASDV